MQRLHAIFAVAALLTGGLAPPAAAQKAAAPFRVVIAGVGIEGCKATGNAEAYRAHLQQRLGRPVSVCGAADNAAAAAALAGGQADMVLTDPDGFAAIKDKARAVLAGRPDELTGRVLSVALVRQSAPQRSLAALTGAVPIVAGAAAASKDVPLRALADAGAPVGSFKPAVVVNGDEAAFAALRAGRGTVLVLTAGARQRVCRPVDPKSQPCSDIRELWRGRPLAPAALVVRTAMPAADRLQLVGIHIGLHFEAPAAMAFMARALLPGMPPAVAFDPAEAGALLRRPA